MVNANATLGGGCPVPPPPSAFLQRIGNGMAAAVTYAENVTALFGNKTESEVSSPPPPFPLSPLFYVPYMHWCCWSSNQGKESHFGTIGNTD